MVVCDIIVSRVVVKLFPKVSELDRTLVFC